MRFCSECQRPLTPADEMGGFIPCHPEAFAQGLDEPEEFIRDAEGAWVPGHVAPPPEPLESSDIHQVPFVLDPQLARIVQLEAELQKLRDMCRAADDQLAHAERLMAEQCFTHPSPLARASRGVSTARAILTKAQETQ